MTSLAPRILTLAAILALLCILAPGARSQATAAHPLGHPRDLLVTSRFTDAVLRYDGTTGAPLGVFATGGGLDNPVGLTFGPDGNLYVASGDTNQVMRYHGRTGAFMDVFASSTNLKGPRQLNFGPDGNLYVASGSNSRILRYDGTTGLLIDAFVKNSFSINGPTSFTFGPDGDLYVASVLNNRVLHYDGQTGDFLEVFATAALSGPHDVAFGPDGRLYVSNAFNNRVVRFEPTGQLVGVFIDDPALGAPLGLTWDDDGDLLLANQGADDVRRYDGVTGDLLDVFVAPGAGGLDGPLFAARFPTTSGLAVPMPGRGTAGKDNTFVVTGGQPGAQVLLAAGLAPGVAPVPGCPTLSFGLFAPVTLADRMADESGRVVVRLPVPASAGGLRVWLEAAQPLTCSSSGPIVWLVP